MSKEKAPLPKEDKSALARLEAERARTQIVVANDNHEPWPCLPFPSGWYGVH